MFAPRHPVVPVKSKVKISQNFVAFSEYMNFTNTLLYQLELTKISSIWNKETNRVYMNCKKILAQMLFTFFRQKNVYASASRKFSKQIEVTLLPNSTISFLFTKFRPHCTFTIFFDLDLPHFFSLRHMCVCVAIQEWHFVTKIVLTYCEKKMFQ